MTEAGWSLHDFGAATFGTALFALCRQVPYLDHLLCRIEERHDPILAEDRVLRNHHRDLARQGWFELRLHETDVVLRSGRSVMLEDKAEFFGVQGRPDLILAGSRVGFGHPLCAVVLPLHRAVVTVRGPRWNIDMAAARRAVALFEAAGVDWSAPLAEDDVAPVVVVGDRNYAHHIWNQLGALETLLARCQHVTVFATHQPLGWLRDIFAEYPDLTVIAHASDDLPRIDPRRFLAFAAGGKVVLPSVRDRVVRLAAARASEPTRRFIADARARGQNLIWLSVRVHDKTALNLVDALAALAESLLRQGGFAIIVDGFARPHDFADNPDYDNGVAKRMIAREQAFTHALCDMLRDRVSDAAMDAVLPVVGGGLLDSIHLAAQCRAYFAHHGTLQHRLGYFTKVPGMVHSNPGILAFDRAGTLQDVIADPGVAEYVDTSLIDDVVPRGGAAGDQNNSYRFNDIPRLVAAFRDLLVCHGVE